MKKLLITIFIASSILGCILFFIRSQLIPDVSALDCGGNGDCNSIQQQIDSLSRDLQSSVNATSNLEQQVSSLNAKIKSIQSSISKFKVRADQDSKSISQHEDQLAKQYTLFTMRVREQYKRSVSFSPLYMILSSGSATSFTRQLAYWQSIQEQDQQIIHSVGQQILKLEQDKKRLEEEQSRLAGLQKQLDTQIAFFSHEISGAKKYQATLQGKIASLSSQQQAILSEKSGTFQTAVGDVPLADDFNASPAFNPGFSPAFAAFSFGAPHFKGMSQYGAYGRAKSGQDAETILHAYYGGGIEIKKDYATNINISVQNYGTVDLETYVKRIYEIPSSWGDNGGFEALKAQAVAARSYALAYTNNGAGSICATEHCQVYKPSNKGGKWEEAVNATRGWVLVTGGKPFSAWYASTSGGYQESYSAQGYTTPGFWDTSNGRSGWTNQAYEKIANSPWFYKSWYRSRSGDSCGHSHPWLTQEEMADILNAWRVLQHGSDSRVSPLGGCWGGSPYSMNELRDKANNNGGAFTSIASVSVDYSNDGYTANVHLSTDQGDVTISGADFKKIFNLRAPGRISLKSGLFNVERR